MTQLFGYFRVCVSGRDRAGILERREGELYKGGRYAQKGDAYAEGVNTRGSYAQGGKLLRERFTFQQNYLYGGGEADTAGIRHGERNIQKYKHGRTLHTVGRY